MIKGVTKRIIEINNPDSLYFEKAVFYIRPSVRKLPDEISRAEAARYISRLGLRYRRKRLSMRIWKLSLAAALLFSGCGAAYAFFH